MSKTAPRRVQHAPRAQADETLMDLMIGVGLVVFPGVVLTIAIVQFCINRPDLALRNLGIG